MRNKTSKALLFAVAGLSAPLCAALAGGYAGRVTFFEPVAVIVGPPSAIRLTESPDGDHQLYGEPRSADRAGLQIRERHRRDTGWRAPEDVSFNTEWNDFDPAFALDGTGVYFFSDRPGGEGGDDIWFVTLTGNTWGEPVNLGPPVNTPGDEWAPTPLAGRRLLFSSDGHAGTGGQDLYIARRSADGWDAPENLGAPINSAADDYDAAFLTEDALMLTRSDDPEGGSELFYSCRSEQGFTEPQLAGPNVNLGGGWALGPSVSDTRPGIVFFSGHEAGASSTRIYRARYEVSCSSAVATR
jgi:hypothetical protein